MEKFKQLITSKKFWTLIAAIVAALSAFFATSCSGMVKIQRHGIHLDTVRTEQIYKSKSYTSWNSPVLTSIPDFGHPTRSLNASTKMLTTFTTSPDRFISFSVSAPTNLRIPPVMDWSPTFSIICDDLISDSTMTKPQTCSQVVSTTRSDFRKHPFGILFLALVPVAVPLKGRRGGRKGRPRPRTKTVPLGGSHL